MEEGCTNCDQLIPAYAFERCGRCVHCIFNIAATVLITDRLQTNTLQHAHETGGSNAAQCSSPSTDPDSELRGRKTMGGTLHRYRQIGSLSPALLPPPALLVDYPCIERASPAPTRRCYADGSPCRDMGRQGSLGFK